MPGLDRLVAEYRYFVVDFLTNAVIAELPIKGVSYERALSSAGAFSGTIPIIDKTMAYNLYDSTMPGKTALYVVRNGACVWGGLIWSRSYSLESRELSINGTEFPSYLHRRNIWKTYTHSYGATVTVSSIGAGVFVLDSGSEYAFSTGMPLHVEFYEEGNKIYNGVVTITGTPTTTSFTANVSGLPIDTYTNVTVFVRVDTYDYARSLITLALSDFMNIEFPNYEIEPGVKTATSVTNKSLTSNVATLTVAGHAASVGHAIVVNGVGAPFDGTHEVTATTSTTVSYSVTSTDVTSTVVSETSHYVVTKAASTDRDALISAAQGEALLLAINSFSEGDYVRVSGVDDPALPYAVFDGVVRLTAADGTSVRYAAQSQNKVDATAVSATALYSYPVIFTATYGPFPANADFNLTFSTNGYSGEEHLKDNIVRGYELKSLGEVISEYADALEGFEYRIDCEYDEATSSFTRTFVFVPIKFPENDPPLAPGEASPLERYGAQNYVFEYPGNIMSVTLDESAEEAATRFFVVGSDNALSNDASQPYSAASANDLLAQGWPLLDSDESKSGIYDETELYNHAKRYLSEFRPPVADMTVTVNGSLQPVVGTYKPGDWCTLIINDDFVRLRLSSNLEPRDDVIVRKIEGVKVQVPDNPSFPEQVNLVLIQEWEIDQVGV